MVRENAHPRLLRIALITGGLSLGGAVTFLCNLSGELLRRKIPVEIFSFENGNPLAADFERLNVPVLRPDPRDLIFEDRLQFILHRVREFKPTVVVASLGSSPLEVLRYVPAGVFRAGICHTDHLRERNTIRPYIRHLDLMAAVSTKILQEFRTNSELKEIPAKYLPLGVPMPPEDKVVKADSRRRLRILYIGRLEREQKRAHLFPEIFEQLKLSGIPFHWTFVGDGAEKTVLERVMKSTSTQTISFLGKLDYAQVPEVLAKHDVYLLVSDYEGLPLSLLEAMGHGLTPVVSDLPSGIPDVVDDSSGIRVPVNDIPSYARAIVQLHSNRDELAAKSAASRARVKKEFSVEAMADRWLSALPKEFPEIGPWPDSWRIRAPLNVPHPIYFSPLMRAARRLAMKFRR